MVTVFSRGLGLQGSLALMMTIPGIRTAQHLFHRNTKIGKSKRSSICRDRGCVDVVWGRLRCPWPIERLFSGYVPRPGQTNAPPLATFLVLADGMLLPCVGSSSRTAQAPPPPGIRSPVPTIHGWRQRRPAGRTLPILFAHQPVKVRSKITAHFER